MAKATKYADEREYSQEMKNRIQWVEQQYKNSFSNVKSMSDAEALEKAEEDAWKARSLNSLTKEYAPKHTLFGRIASNLVSSTVIRYPRFETTGGGYESLLERFHYIVSPTAISPLSSETFVLSNTVMRSVTDSIGALSITKQISLAQGLVGAEENPMDEVDKSAAKTMASLIDWMMFFGVGNRDSNSKESLGLSKILEEENETRTETPYDFISKVLEAKRRIVRKGAVDPVLYVSEETWDSLLEDYENMGESLSMLARSRSIEIIPTPVLNADRINLKDPSSNPTLRSRDTHFYRVKASVNSESEGNVKYLAVLNKGEEIDICKFSMTDRYETVPVFFQLPEMSSNYIEDYETVNIYKQDTSSDNEEEYCLIHRESLKDETKSLISVDVPAYKYPGETEAFIGDLSPQVISSLELLPVTAFILPLLNATITTTYIYQGMVSLNVPNAWHKISGVKA